MRLLRKVASVSIQPLRRMSEKKALLILAEGAEEMEAIITVDVLRRAGVEVTIGGLAGAGAVKCSRGVVVTPDAALADVASKHWDAVILPGGQPGSNSLAASKPVGHLLREQHAAGRVVAAICAAPIAFEAHGIAPGAHVTSYPGVKQRLVDAGYKYSEDHVVVDGHVVTSRGPGTAFDFALKLVEVLLSKEKADAAAKPMLYGRH